MAFTTTCPDHPDADLRVIEDILDHRRAYHADEPVTRYANRIITTFVPAVDVQRARRA